MSVRKEPVRTPAYQCVSVKTGGYLLDQIRVLLVCYYSVSEYK